MPDQPHRPLADVPFIHLIYSTPDLAAPDQSAFASRMTALNKAWQGDQVSLTWDLQDAQKCSGQIRLGEHNLQVAGLASPLSQNIIDRTINVSHWQPQIRAAMRQPLSHISLVYTGLNPDPVEKMVALYSAANGFVSENLLGVVNENAWAAHPAVDFLTPDNIAAYRHEIPFNLWIGYVKIYTDKEHYWLTTKGHHIFDVPDLAFYVDENEDANQCINAFINIFYYIFEQDVAVAAGDTLELNSSGQTFQFAEVTELLLLGPAGTLVIKKISPEERNPT